MQQLRITIYVSGDFQSIRFRFLLVLQTKGTELTKEADKERENVLDSVLTLLQSSFSKFPDTQLLKPIEATRNKSPIK